MISRRSFFGWIPLSALAVSAAASSVLAAPPKRWHVDAQALDGAYQLDCRFGSGREWRCYRTTMYWAPTDSRRDLERKSALLRARLLEQVAEDGLDASSLNAIIGDMFFPIAAETCWGRRHLLARLSADFGLGV